MVIINFFYPANESNLRKVKYKIWQTLDMGILNRATKAWSVNFRPGDAIQGAKRVAK